MSVGAFTEQDYSLAYPEGIQNHFWSTTRLQVIMHLMRKHDLKKKKMLEIGSGKGVMLRELRKKGLNVFGADLSDVDSAADVSPFLFLNQDALALDDSFRDSIEVILLLDVIEHIESDSAFLNSILKAFVNVKAVLIMVPARKEFWSNYDEYYGHHRRYDMQMTGDLGRGVKMRVEENTYFFHFIYLVALILFRISGKREIKASAPKGIMIAIHRLVAFMCYVEYLVMPRQVPGSSITLLLTK
jgi:hypothetical protein